MKNKDFLEFIMTKEAVPAAMKKAAALDIRLSFRTKQILLKFLAFQIIGALFSMSVCPQFGMGLVEGHGITHTFRMIGDWACAAFCGSLFLSSGMLVAFIGMKGEELWWIWNRYKFPMIILPAVLWAGLMFTNVTLALPGESVNYHFTWILTAILIEALWFHTRSVLVLRGLADSKSY